MPHVTAHIAAGGPVVELRVGVSLSRANALRQAGLDVPQQMAIRGLIDTGASCTCIDPGCLSFLGLQPTGQTVVHTPTTGGTPHPCNQYDVSIMLLHPGLTLTFGVVPVIASDLSLQGIDALVGRDILVRCLFVYDGPANMFSLAF